MPFVTTRTPAVIKRFHHIQERTFSLSVVANGNRINVQKPRPPHYDRQKIEALVRPRYFEKGERDSWFIPSVSMCMKEKEEEIKKKSKEEENPYERLLAKDLRNWFMNSKLIAFFHINPIKFDPQFDNEVKLRKENMYYKHMGKHTVEMALKDTPYISVMPLFVSHTGMVFCSEPRVDKLMKLAPKLQKYTLLAAIVEDRLLSVSQLRELSRVGDLTSARSQLVATLNSAQSHLVSGLTSHQTHLAEALRLYSLGDTKSQTKESKPPPTDSKDQS